MNVLLEARKALVTIVGAAAILSADGFFHGNIAQYVAIGLGAATALGVYIVPNKTPGINAEQSAITLMSDNLSSLES